MSTPTAAATEFSDPHVTAKGELRASVQLEELETLWFNTGTLCNIECVHCYIESSPTNNRLVYLSAHEVADYLDEIRELGLETREIGFTGGEPFLNPELPDMLDDALSRGFEALVLTNAMKPMMRPVVQGRLQELAAEHGEKLTLRVSLDHYTADLHDTERGPGAFEVTLAGLRWLAEHGIAMDVAGRTCWGESPGQARDGYRRLFESEGFPVDADDPASLVLFPEMDADTGVPEITVDCWEILGVDPAAMMCASSRMVVKRKGTPSPTVLACTLLPYDPEFELGNTLAEALGKVQLNHRWCAQFCVLGGGSCSVAD